MPVFKPVYRRIAYDMQTLHIPNIPGHFDENDEYDFCNAIFLQAVHSLIPE